MKPFISPVMAAVLGLAASHAAPPALEFSPIRRLTNSEMLLRLSAPTGSYCRLEVSTNLAQWNGLVTLWNAGVTQHTDSAAPFLRSRFYRALTLSGTNLVTGDHLVTTNAEVVLYPGNHAGLALGWNGRMVYVDPVTNVFRSLPPADLILLTHAHTDHLSTNTIRAVRGSNVVILAPSAVAGSLPTDLRTNTTVLANGASTNWLGMLVEAMPMYNLSSGYHPKGVGNAYVLTLDGRRIYISGDTDNTPEVRALTNIDAAFLCMRPPYSMDVTNAASAVRTFRPRVVYPYHYLGNDVNVFKQLVGTDLGIEVRLRAWY